jgi:hypothetical protein
MAHERKALWVLWVVMRRHMLDQFGEIRPGGCYDLVCKGLDDQPLPSWAADATDGESAEWRWGFNEGTETRIRAEIDGAAT